MKEHAPPGKLRLGVVAAPAKSTFFVLKDPAGPRGVTADLGTALGQKLGLPVEFFVADNSGQVTDALASGTIDVAFMPMDDERRKRVDFGPAYFNVESTYLVTAASGIKSLAEVDRPGVRVGVSANTTTIRSAVRTLKNTTATAAASVDEAMAMMRHGRADACGLSHDSLPPLAA